MFDNLGSVRDLCQFSSSSRPSRGSSGVLASSILKLFVLEQSLLDTATLTRAHT